MSAYLDFKKPEPFNYYNWQQDNIAVKRREDDSTAEDVRAHCNTVNGLELKAKTRNEKKIKN